MAGDATTFLQDLPPWAQVAANLAIFTVTAAAGAFAYFKNKSRPEASAVVVDTKNQACPVDLPQRLIDNSKLDDIHETLLRMEKAMEEELREREIEREVLRRMSQHPALQTK